MSEVRSDSLSTWFRNSYRGGDDCDVPGFSYLLDETIMAHCLKHDASGCHVWPHVIDVSNESSDAVIIFHDTNQIGYVNITSLERGSVEVLASLITSGPKANAWYGAGAYGTIKGPDDFQREYAFNGFHSILDAIVDNNFRRMAERDGSEVYYERVQYCVPLCVAREDAYDVCIRETPEMLQAGHGAGRNIKGDQLNESGKPVRDQWVIRVAGEEGIDNARANVLDVLRLRAESGLFNAGELAVALVHRGCYEEAEPHFRKVLDSYKTERIADATERIGFMGVYAVMLRRIGRYSEAEPLARQVLSHLEETIGMEHRQTVVQRCNVAELMHAMGKYDESEHLFRRVLAAQEESLCDEGSDENLEIISTLHNLACLLHVRSADKHDESEHLFRRCLSAEERTLGAEHPTTLQTIEKLGELLMSMKRYDESEALLRRSLEAKERTLDAEAPYLLTAQSTFAELLHSMGRSSEAEPLMRKVIETHERAGRGEHKDALACLFNFAVMLETVGKYGEAEQLLDRCLENGERALGLEHPITVGCRERLGQMLYNMGRKSEALVYFRQAHDVRKRKYGEHDPKTKTLEHNIQAITVQLGLRHNQEDVGSEAAPPGALHGPAGLTVNCQVQLVRNVHPMLRGLQGRVAEQYPNGRWLVKLDDGRAVAVWPYTMKLVSSQQFNEMDLSSFIKMCLPASAPTSTATGTPKTSIVAPQGNVKNSRIEPDDEDLRAAIQMSLKSLDMQAHTSAAVAAYQNHVTPSMSVDSNSDDDDDLLAAIQLSLRASVNADTTESPVVVSQGLVTRPVEGSMDVSGFCSDRVESESLEGDRNGQLPALSQEINQEPLMQSCIDYASPERIESSTKRNRAASADLPPFAAQPGEKSTEQEQFEQLATPQPTPIQVDASSAAGLTAFALSLEKGRFAPSPAQLARVVRESASRMRGLEETLNELSQTLQVVNGISAMAMGLRGGMDELGIDAPPISQLKEGGRSFLIKKGDADLQELHQKAASANPMTRTTSGTTGGGALSSVSLTKEEMDKAREARLAKLEAMQQEKSKEQAEAHERNRAREAMFSRRSDTTGKLAGKY